MSGVKFTPPPCKDMRACFGKRRDAKGRPVCNVLSATYEDGKCPFYKTREQYRREMEGY